MAEYYLTTGMLRRWGACNTRFAPARLFPDRRIPLTPEACDTIQRLGYGPAYWLGFLVAREDRWDHFRALVGAEIAALRATQVPGRLSAALLRHMDDILVAEQPLEAPHAMHGLAHYHAKLHGGDEATANHWVLDIVLRTVDAIEPGTLDVYPNPDDDGLDDPDPRVIAQAGVELAVFAEVEEDEEDEDDDNEG